MLKTIAAQALGREIASALLQGDDEGAFASLKPYLSQKIPLSSLDVCAVVEEGDPPRHVMQGGRPILHNAGSLAVRRAIEKYQPLLSLHGHIHESPGVIRIGRTLCVSPGSEYNEGILRGMVAILQDGKIHGHQLTAG